LNSVYGPQKTEKLKYKHNYKQQQRQTTLATTCVDNKHEQLLMPAKNPNNKVLELIVGTHLYLFGNHWTARPFVGTHVDDDDDDGDDDEDDEDDDDDDDDEDDDKMLMIMMMINMMMQMIMHMMMMRMMMMQKMMKPTVREHSSMVLMFSSC
jgi:hypothetical protein